MDNSSTSSGNEQRKLLHLLKHKLLVLGAGFVSPPFINYFSTQPDVLVTVVSALEHEVERVVSYGYKNVHALKMDNA